MIFGEIITAVAFLGLVLWLGFEEVAHIMREFEDRRETRRILEARRRAWDERRVTCQLYPRGSGRQR